MRNTVSALLVALFALPASPADSKPLPYPLRAELYRDWTYRTVHDIFRDRYAVTLTPLNPRVPLPSLYVASESFLEQCVPKVSSRKHTTRTIPSAFFPHDNEILVAREHLSRQTRLVAHEFVHYILYHYSRIDLGEKWEENLANEVETRFAKHVAELDYDQRAGGE